ncbi:hypothetical protein BGZ95_000134 [Linnemannia exigua]|uniref:Uncharacterized protein n=1 Tax=Linnemannia exigua TaxID=604196 RepID=A0AAD4DAT4_9FUNG|nr:hypothetical protein BGZ95_000134 [Linnemannia exigua]
MSQCVIDFDTCHQICFPEEHIPGGPEPAILPAAPDAAPDAAPEVPQKHKDVTEGSTDDDDDEDGDEGDQEGEFGSSIVAEVGGGGGKKVLHGKGKGHVKAAAKEAVGLTLTPEEINRMQQSYKDDVDDENIIPAPMGGEDDSDIIDDPSDY